MSIYRRGYVISLSKTISNKHISVYIAMFSTAVSRKQKNFFISKYKRWDWYNSNIKIHIWQKKRSVCS